MNIYKNYNEEEFLKMKNEIYNKAYNNKIFKGRVITIKPPNVIFNEKTYYDIFFTKTKNENFCNLENKKAGIYTQSWATKTLNFDYESSITKLNLVNSESKDIYNIQEIILSRNVCLVNHSNLQVLFEKRNYDFSKSNFKNAQNFISLENQYFMLEIRIKKQEDSISINDKEDLKECYLLIVENIEEIVELFSICKYLVHFEEDALKNYISKYIFETVNQFIRINENSLNFFEELGIINNECESLIFPLKDPIKKIRQLFYQGKLLTYFKSDNRSFYDYIQKVSLLDPAGKKRADLSIQYSKYLSYKVLMDEEISNSKDFKVKKYVTKQFCASLASNDLIDIPEVITASDKFLSKNNEDLLDVSKYLEDKSIFKTEESEKTNKLQSENQLNNEKFQKYFSSDNNYKKLRLEEIEFLKNVKIEKDNILDIDSLYEFFFKVLNRAILNEANKNISSDSQRTSNSPFEESKEALHRISIEEKTNRIFFPDPQKENEIIEFKNSKSPKEKFLINALKKSIIKYITTKGFFNVDIILNEDEFRKINLCNCFSKNIQTCFGNFFYCLGNCALTLFNSLLSINEGLIHKHFSIFSLSYNFNEKNRIFTFNSKFDASKKNKLRVYDVLFNENWAEEIAKLIALIYKEFYGMKSAKAAESFKSHIEEIPEEYKNDKKFFLKAKKTNDKNKSSEKKLLNFLNKFKECVELITKEFFESYHSVLPDFKSFCKNLARFPISRYNVIDNLCQHFTNSSVQVLLNKSIMFYLRASDIKEYNKKLKSKIGIVNLDTPIEPYLINVDKNFRSYLNGKGYFEEFIRKAYKNADDFIAEIKKHNRYNQHVQDILKLNCENDFDYFKKELENEFKLKLKIKCFSSSSCKKTNLNENDIESNFDYYSLLNLSHFFNYKIDSELPNLIIHYCLLKQKCEKLIPKGKSKNYSYDADFDRTEKRFRFSFKVPKDSQECSKKRSAKKDEIIESYLKMHKINKHTENLSLMFYNYCVNIAEEIYIEKKTKFYQNFTLGKTRKCSDSSLIDTCNVNNEWNKLKVSPKEISETKLAYISTFDGENQKFNKPSIINNASHFSFFVKIGHLVVNCEKVFKNDRKGQNFFDDNVIIEAKRTDCQNTNLNENNLIVNNDPKSINSYELSCGKGKQIDEFDPSIENEKMRKSKSKSIN